jgi:hypothetical protein
MSKKKNRRSPLAVLSTQLQERDERLSQKAEQVEIHRPAVNCRPKVLVGVSQHPYTKSWQIWLSLSGRDISVLTAHRQALHANIALRAILWKLTDPATLAQPDPLSFLDNLRGDTAPIPFPSVTEAQIRETIGRSDNMNNAQTREVEVMRK